MERNHRNSEILVIDRNPFDLAEAQQWLEEGFTHVEVATSLKSGLERLLSANIGFILCNLELVESNEQGGPCDTGGASAENEKKLLNLGIPIVFLSVGQQADVVFKPIEGRSSPSFFLPKKIRLRRTVPYNRRISNQNGLSGQKRFSQLPVSPYHHA